MAIYGTTLQAWSSSICKFSLTKKEINPTDTIPDQHYKVFQGGMMNTSGYLDMYQLTIISHVGHPYLSPITSDLQISFILTATAPTSTQVLIYIDVKHAIDLGIRFFLSSRPSPFFAPPIPSLYRPIFGREASSSASDSSATESDSPSQTTHRDRQFQPPPPTKSPTVTTYKNRSTQIITPGNEFGMLPLECFTKVEVVSVKRKVLWPFDEQDKKEESAILGSDMKPAKQVNTRGYWTEDVEDIERDLDQFFVDLPDEYQALEVHPDLRKEALANFSI
jgi:hypothetical protein